ncbi:MAG: peroxiredoxin family protein [Acidobacteriia bacterium]|nr:peroxiredoxin family protein [Terriglobia bacterium]
MRSIEEHRQQIESRGVKIVAISVDPPQVTKEHAARRGYSFLFLADETLEVIGRYDLVHKGGSGSSDIARPAEFLLNPQGVVRWRNLTESYRVRAKGEQILEALDRAGVPAAGPTEPNESRGDRNAAPNRSPVAPPVPVPAR